MGNVEKISKHSKQLNIATLEELVQHELSTKTHKNGGSATDALVWLKRGLWLFCKFLVKISQGERNPTNGFRQAYEETLSKHHNFVVRGMVKVMLNALPANETLINLLMQKHDENDGSKEEVLKRHLVDYTDAMQPLLSQLDEFYTGNGLSN